MQKKIPFESATTVAVEVDDAWELFARSDVRLEVTAF